MSALQIEFPDTLLLNMFNAFTATKPGITITVGQVNLKCTKRTFFLSTNVQKFSIILRPYNCLNLSFIVLFYFL